MKRAIIIIIGDELLQGFTNDTNSMFISKYLRKSKIEVISISTQGDNRERMLKIFSEIFENKECDYVIITGGLGPTHDDITKNVLKEYFNTEFIIDEKYLEQLKTKFKKYKLSIPNHIKSQATYLKNSVPIINKIGTALGMNISYNNKNIVVLPGVPSEMEQMISDVGLFDYSNIDNDYCTLKTAGIYEAKLYDILAFLIKAENHFKIAFLPKYSGVDIRISKKNNKSNKSIISIKKKITKLIGEYIYSDKNEALEEVVAKELIKRKLTLSVAESCTGGMISKMLTDMPGSSKFFIGSVVAYNNSIKNKILSVDEKKLNRYGAVSEEVALDMSKGIKQITKSDLSIATTGVSGPDGGSNEKPIGLIFIALNFNDEEIVKKFNLSGNRDINRKIASNIALNLIRLIIKNK